MLVWFGETIRPTRDADLLGFGDLSDEALANIFQDICAVEVEPDAMTYLKDSIRVSAIRPEDTYGGKRVTLGAQLGSARLRVQVDVGIGDAVLPPPEWLDYPSLLELPRPRLRAYRPETVIAEKFHAMVVLGAKNSRMRDFFDVYILATLQSFDGEPLARALRATFVRIKISLNCLESKLLVHPRKQQRPKGFCQKQISLKKPVREHQKEIVRSHEGRSVGDNRDVFVQNRVSGFYNVTSRIKYNLIVHL